MTKHSFYVVDSAGAYVAGPFKRRRNAESAASMRANVFVTMRPPVENDLSERIIDGNR